MSQTILGTTQIQVQPLEKIWDGARGAITTVTMEAAGDDGKQNILGVSEELKNQQIDHHIKETFGKSTLIAQYGFDPDTDPTNERPVTIWEVRPNRVPKELYQHPDVVKYQNTATYPITVANGLKNALMVLRTCVNATSLDAADTAGITRPPDDTIASTYSSWFEAYDLMIGGTTQYVVEQSVIIRTETTSAAYARTTLIDNTNAIFTPDQMISMEACPEEIVEVESLPSGLTAFDPTDPGFGFLYGYRKGKPEMTRQALNKWQVRTQWEQGIYAMFTHDPATDGSGEE